MEADVLKTVGQVAGIGGIALGVFLLLYRDLLRKSIFPTLKQGHAYRLLGLIAVLVWSVAILGVAAWVWVEQSRAVGSGERAAAADETLVARSLVDALLRAKNETIAAKDETIAEKDRRNAEQGRRIAELTRRLDESGLRRQLNAAAALLLRAAAEPEAPPAVAEAIAALERGDTAPAETLLESLAAIETTPAGARAATQRAIGALAFLRDPDQAASAFEKAVTLDPSDSETWYQLGWTRHEAGRLEAAEAAYARSVEVAAASGNEAGVARASAHLADARRERGAIRSAPEQHRREAPPAANTRAREQTMAPPASTRPAPGEELSADPPAPTAGAGHGEAAQVLLEIAFGDVLAALREEAPTTRDRGRRTYELVVEHVAPHFDFGLMARWALGKHWRRANAEQRTRFVVEYATLVTRTVSTLLSALSQHSGETVSFLPMRARKHDEVSVRTQFDHTEGPPTPVRFEARHRTDGWKVVDVNFDGISLVFTHRTEVSYLLNRDGIEGMIDALEERNRMFIEGHQP